jgi:hypothetical protein
MDACRHIDPENAVHDSEHECEAGTERGFDPINRSAIRETQSVSGKMFRHVHTMAVVAGLGG